MAVYTQLDKPQIEEILARYNIDNLAQYKGIAQGVENSNYLIICDDNKYILTIYEERTNKADLPFFVGLMERLAALGVSCPLPIKTTSGDDIIDIFGKAGALFSFLDGKSVRRVTPDNCYQVGASLADFHVKSADFGLSRDNSMSFIEFYRLFGNIKSHKDSWLKPIKKEIEQTLDILANSWEGLEDLPKGIIHGDLFPDNVFFKDGALSGLLDFYFACNDYLAYDVAITLNAWCFEGGTDFNITKARKLLAGYQSVRELKPVEKQYFPILCSVAALRFCLTRLYDKFKQQDADVTVEIKNPQEYLEKLRFHRQIKSYNEYGCE